MECVGWIVDTWKLGFCGREPELGLGAWNRQPAVIHAMAMITCYSIIKPKDSVAISIVEKVLARMKVQYAVSLKILSDMGMILCRSIFYSYPL